MKPKIESIFQWAWKFVAEVDINLAKHENLSIKRVLKLCFVVVRKLFRQYPTNFIVESSQQPSGKAERKPKGEAEGKEEVKKNSKNAEVRGIERYYCELKMVFG